MELEKVYQLKIPPNLFFKVNKKTSRPTSIIKEKEKKVVGSFTSSSYLVTANC